MKRLSNTQRLWLHIPLGGITVIMTRLNPVIGFLFAAVFVVYELNEDKHDRNDQAWVDLKGYLWGIGIAMIFYAAIHYGKMFL